MEQEEQLEQSAKVIRYLQGQLQQQPPSGAGGTSGGGGAGAREQLLTEQLEATQDECDELRSQVRYWPLTLRDPPQLLGPLFTASSRTPHRAHCVAPASVRAIRSGRSRTTWSRRSPPGRGRAA